MGLCRAHNNLENRHVVAELWKKTLQDAIAAETKLMAIKAGAHDQLLTVHFTGGGSLSVPCGGFSLSENSLQAHTAEGAVFFPLNQVRHYALAPNAGRTAEDEQTAETA